MDDREKVIRGLEVCSSIADGATCPKDCPYYQDVCYGYDQLMRDALALMKEQQEIVRCKYCEYLSYPANGVPFCKRIKNFVDANWFCADGKKAVKWDA